MTLSNFPIIPFTRALLATILLLLVLCVLSCSPERRFHKLTSEHPELMHKDTVLVEVIKFRVDTLKADSISTIASTDLQNVIDSLILDLDSCSKIDKAKIQNLTPTAKAIFKKRLVTDCPEIMKRDTLRYTTAEGHTVILIPNQTNGYNLKLVVNCPIPVLKERKLKWWNWFLIGLAIGAIVTVYITKSN